MHQKKLDEMGLDEMGINPIICSVVVSLWLPTDIFKLQRNLVASYPIFVFFSSLEMSTSFVFANEKVQSVLESK